MTTLVPREMLPSTTTLLRTLTPFSLGGETSYYFQKASSDTVDQGREDNFRALAAQFKTHVDMCILGDYLQIDKLCRLASKALSKLITDTARPESKDCTVLEFLELLTTVVSSGILSGKNSETETTPSQPNGSKDDMPNRDMIIDAIASSLSTLMKYIMTSSRPHQMVGPLSELLGSLDGRLSYVLYSAYLWPKLEKKKAQDAAVVPCACGGKTTKSSLKPSLFGQPSFQTRPTMTFNDFSGRRH